MKEQTSSNPKVKRLTCDECGTDEAVVRHFWIYPYKDICPKCWSKYLPKKKKKKRKKEEKKEKGQ
jgi:RNase P subunit RPR2